MPANTSVTFQTQQTLLSSAKRTERGTEEEKGREETIFVFVPSNHHP